LRRDSAGYLFGTGLVILSGQRTGAPSARGASSASAARFAWCRPFSVRTAKAPRPPARTASRLLGPPIVDLPRRQVDPDGRSALSAHAGEQDPILSKGRPILWIGVWRRHLAPQGLSVGTPARQVEALASFRGVTEPDYALLRSDRVTTDNGDSGRRRGGRAGIAVRCDLISLHDISASLVNRVEQGVEDHGPIGQAAVRRLVAGGHAARAQVAREVVHDRRLDRPRRSEVGDQNHHASDGQSRREDVRPSARQDARRPRGPGLDPLNDLWG